MGRCFYRPRLPKDCPDHWQRAALPHSLGRRRPCPHLGPGLWPPAWETVAFLWGPPFVVLGHSSPRSLLRWCTFICPFCHLKRTECHFSRVRSPSGSSDSGGLRDCFWTHGRVRERGDRQRLGPLRLPRGLGSESGDGQPSFVYSRISPPALVTYQMQWPLKASEDGQ